MDNLATKCHPEPVEGWFIKLSIVRQAHYDNLIAVLKIAARLTISKKTFLFKKEFIQGVVERNRKYNEVNIMKEKTWTILAIILIVAAVAIVVTAFFNYAEYPGTEPSEVISVSAGYPESGAKEYIKLGNATFRVAGLNDNGTVVAISLLGNPDNETFVIREVKLTRKDIDETRNFRTFRKVSKKDTTVSFNFSSFNSDDFLLEGFIFVDEGEKHPDTIRSARFVFDVYRKGPGEDIIFWHQRPQAPQEPGFEGILFAVAIIFAATKTRRR